MAFLPTRKAKKESGKGFLRLCDIHLLHYFTTEQTWRIIFGYATEYLNLI